MTLATSLTHRRHCNNSSTGSIACSPLKAGGVYSSSLPVGGSLCERYTHTHAYLIGTRNSKLTCVRPGDAIENTRTFELRRKVIQSFHCDHCASPSSSSSFLCSGAMGGSEPCGIDILSGAKWPSPFALSSSSAGAILPHHLFLAHRCPNAVAVMRGTRQEGLSTLSLFGHRSRSPPRHRRASLSSIRQRRPLYCECSTFFNVLLENSVTCSQHPFAFAFVFGRTLGIWMGVEKRRQKLTFQHRQSLSFVCLLL